MNCPLRSVVLLVTLLQSVAWFQGTVSAQNDTRLWNAEFRIAYATYYGGGAWDQAREVIPSPDGTVLVGGMTSSSHLPTTPGVVQPQYAGDDPALGHGGVFGGDAFLLRLSPQGDKSLSATYFGGSKQERGVYGMLLDSDGNIVIGSATRSSDMPTTPGSYQQQYGGGEADMYAAKLTPDMKRIIWCSYVGGSKNDWPRGGLTLDKDDNVYLAGGVNSDDFPTTENAFQRRRKGERDAAIVKLSADGSKLLFSTLLGGNGWDGLMGVHVDERGDIFVAGHTRSTDFPVTRGAPQPDYAAQSDCFVAKLSGRGNLVYATYLGGRENEFAEHRPWLGADGTLLLTGVSASPDFPTTADAFQRKLQGKNDGFVTKVASDGKTFVFSTLLGGSSGGEFFLMPTPDRDGNILVVGHSTSGDFPVTANALQKTYAGGRRPQDGDGVLAVLSPDGKRLLYATYLGGNGDDLIRSVAFGPRGEVFLVGSTTSTDFPVTDHALQSKFAGGTGDAFIVKLVTR